MYLRECELEKKEQKNKEKTFLTNRVQIIVRFPILFSSSILLCSFYNYVFILFLANENKKKKEILSLFLSLIKQFYLWIICSLNTHTESIHLLLCNFFILMSEMGET